MDRSGTRTGVGRRRAGEPPSVDAPSTPPDPSPETDQILATLEEIGLEPTTPAPLRSARSLLFPSRAQDGQEFLLKYFLSCPVPWYEPGLDPDGDARRREGSFYRFLDVVDRDRCFANIPRLVMADPGDPPRWILFEGIPGVKVAGDENPRPDWLLDSMRALQGLPAHLTDNRRGLALENWDPYTHREVIFTMRDAVEPRVGPKAWDLLCRTLHEAREWSDTASLVLVNGWFQEDNLLLDEVGRIYQHEFRRVGLGSKDIDFGWFWVHCNRDVEWRRQIYHLYTSTMGTSGKIRVEWAARSIAVYKACVEIAKTGPDADIDRPLELLERGILGGSLLFP